MPAQFWQKLASLLWGRYRGLAFYAPILLLAIPGWVVLAVRRNWDAAVVTFSASIAVLLVNMFYPEWTGGWSTGPRLLVPMLPFAMLPVAALLSGKSRGATVATAAAVILALAGGLLMLVFQSVGGRIPQDYTDPLVQTVWPVCSGEVPLPYWRFDGERFSQNLDKLDRAGIDRPSPRQVAVRAVSSTRATAGRRHARPVRFRQERRSSGRTSTVRCVVTGADEE